MRVISINQVAHSGFFMCAFIYGRATILLGLTLLLPISLSSCISLDANADTYSLWSKETRIGLILISQKQSEQATISQTVNVIGAWAGVDGYGFGANRETSVQASTDCQIVFIIKNKEQLDHAVSLVAALPNNDGEKICINT